MLFVTALIAAGMVPFSYLGAELGFFALVLAIATAGICIRLINKRYSSPYAFAWTLVLACIVGPIDILFVCMVLNGSI